MSNDSLIKIFTDLVNIDSPTGEEKKVAEFITSFFEERNIDVNSDDFGNVIAKIPGIGEPLFLSAHMDTVEPGRGIKPIIKNGIIKSDGTTILGADNKDALSLLLNLVDRIKEEKFSHRPLELVFTRFEESECLGAVKLNYKKLISREGFIFDAAKPIGTVITASPYYLRFDIKIVGNSAHASRPELANNAILVFSEAMKNIKVGKVNSKTIANIGMISSGYVRNTIPGELILKGEVRSFENGVVEEISERIISQFKNAAKKYGSKIDFDSVLENPGYEYKNNDPIVRFAIKKLEENKIKPILEKYQGCSDANIFNNQGLRILNLGNGSEFAHTMKEQVRVKDLERLSNLILSIVAV